MHEDIEEISEEEFPEELLEEWPSDFHKTTSI